MNVLYRYNCDLLTPFTVFGTGITTQNIGGIDGKCIKIVAPATAISTGIELSKPKTDNLKIASFWFRPLFNSIKNTTDGVIARIYTTDTVEVESFRIITKKFNEQKFQIGLQNAVDNTVNYASELLDVSYDINMNSLLTIPAGGLTDAIKSQMRASSIGLNKVTISITDSNIELFVNHKQGASATLAINSTNKNLTKLFLGFNSGIMNGSSIIYDDLKLGTVELSATTDNTKVLSSVNGWLNRFVTNEGCQIRPFDGSLDRYTFLPSFNPLISAVVDVTVTTGDVQISGNTINGSPVFVPNTSAVEGKIYKIIATGETVFVEFTAGQYRELRARVDTISEGTGYALRMAFAINDQVLFDKIETFAQSKWQRNATPINHINTADLSKAPLMMCWKSSPTLVLAFENDIATDGDEDRIIALIEAHYKWGSTGTINYKQRAIDIAENIWNFASSPFEVNLEVLRVPVISLNTTQFNNSLTNPSYFNPQLWKMLEILTTDQKWKKITRGIYAMMTIANNYNLSGMPNNFIPFSWDGTIRTTDLDNNDYHSKSSYDAVRYFWRMYQDYSINKDIRVIDAMQKGANWALNNSFNNAYYYPIVNCKTGAFQGGIENMTAVVSRLFANKAINQSVKETEARDKLINNYITLSDGSTFHDNVFGSLDSAKSSNYYNEAVANMGALLYTNQLSIFPKTSDFKVIKNSGAKLGIKSSTTKYKFKDY
jgi:endo-1,4-beta-D-glucanase Y